jgi:flagellar protein FliO/FliZ
VRRTAITLSCRLVAVAAATAALVAPGVSLAAAAAPGPGPGPGQLLQLMLGLLAVIAAVLLLARWLPRLQGMRAGGGGSLRVVDALPLGQKERLLLVQVGEQQLLLGVTAGTISTLHRLDRPVEAGADAALDAGAGSWLARVLNRRPS